MSPDSENVNQLLRDWSSGNQQALEELLPLIYNELRHLVKPPTRVNPLPSCFFQSVS